MISYILTKLSYNKEEKLRFLSKRLGGVWLIWIGLVLIVSIYMGGNQLVHQTVFSLGYGVGLFVFFGVTPVRKLLSYGTPSLFQRKMTYLSIILMFILMFFLGGPYYATTDYRMIWLGALMAVAIHFIPFTFVHGKTMLVLSALLIIVVGIGYASPTIPFSTIGYIDAAIKMIFGIALLFSKNPIKHEIK
jgi:hypothetical protein